LSFGGVYEAPGSEGAEHVVKGDPSNLEAGENWQRRGLHQLKKKRGVKEEGVHSDDVKEIRGGTVLPFVSPAQAV